MASPTLSENAKLYINSGTYASPTWDEVTLVKDVQLNMEKGEADVTTRASGGYTETADGLISATIDFGILYDTTDTEFNSLRSAFTGKTSVEVLVLDGDQSTTGNQGLRATCMVKTFNRSETLGEALMVDVSLLPTSNSDSAPSWFTS